MQNKRYSLGGPSQTSRITLWVSSSSNLKWSIRQGLIVATVLVLSIVAVVASGRSSAFAATPPDSCFDFNTNTGTIVAYHTHQNNNPSSPTCTRAVDIPATIGGVAVTSIGEEAFAFYSPDNRLTSLTIPNGVTSIGDSAFKGNELATLVLPNSVTSIGEGAFNGNLLTTLTLSSNLTRIENRVFADNFLTTVTIPDGVTTIGDGAFFRNRLTSVTIPNSVTTIEEDAFLTNLLTTVTIPNSVTTIEEDAFIDNRLTSVTLDNVLLSQAQLEGAFRYSNLDYEALYDNADTTARHQYLFDNLTLLPVYTANPANPAGYTSVLWPESSLTDMYYNSGDIDLNNDGDLNDPAGGLLVNPAQLTVRYVNQNGTSVAPDKTQVGPVLNEYKVRSLLNAVGTRDITTNDIPEFYYMSGASVSQAAPSIEGMTLTSAASQTLTLQPGSNTMTFVYNDPNAPSQNGGSDDSGSSVPGVPNTGIGTLTRHPVIAVVLMIVGIVTAIVIRQMKAGRS